MNWFLIGYPVFVALSAICILLAQFDYSGVDAPAWVQAVGSIAAIIVSFLLLYVQHWREQRAERRRRHDRQANFLMMTVLVMDDFHQAMKDVIDTGTTLKQTPAVILKFSDQRMSQVSRALESIPISEMQTEHAQAIAVLKLVASRNESALVVAAHSEVPLLEPYINMLRTHLDAVGNMVATMRTAYVQMTGKQIQIFDNYATRAVQPTQP